MKLTEALGILNTAKASGRPVSRCVLACNFTPLHLSTFLAAHLQRRRPEVRIEVVSPVFGDTAANLSARSIAGAGQVVVALEWTDLDPRLGYRLLGGWRETQLASMVSSAQSALDRVRDAISAAATGVPIVVALPSLRLPPAFHTGGGIATERSLTLRMLVLAFGRRVSELRNVRVIDSDVLEAMSPIATRHDFKADLTTGFPYTLAHASALGVLAARCMAPAAPMKGLITDLDDTVWKGLVGEVGAAGVSWEIDRKSQMHGVYQQLLESLADTGALLAVASKNNPGVVDAVWSERADMILRKESVFPLEVHWRPKSESVAAILERWNIGADSVVFVDDSPHEVAEVQAAFPQMTCLLFPKDSYDDAIALFHRLRALFSKEAVLDEDRLRLASIRNAAEFQERSSGSPVSQREFLEELRGVITFTLNPPAEDARTLQLVNKTNQFNVNGVRRTETEWLAPDTFVISIAYEDRLGPLGTIGVLRGAQVGHTVRLDTWVLSCRAFSRLIEHHTLAFLFNRYDAEAIVIEHQPTPRNSVSTDLLKEFADSVQPGDVVIRRDAFESRHPPLDAQVRVKGADASPAPIG